MSQSGVFTSDWILATSPSVSPEDCASTFSLVKTGRVGVSLESVLDEGAAPLEQRRNIVVAIDGSEACLRALAFGCKHLVNPKRDRVTLLSVGELDLDVSDVMMEAFDSAISLIGVDADNSMKHAKTRYALQIAKQTLLKAEEALHGHFLDESTRGADHVFYRLCGLASATPQDAIAGFMNAVSMEHDCENAVLVVGSRGMGTVSRLLVGSTTDYLLHNCVGGCTLVIVK